jgi:pimeloyl-ACP methyl ester carboxylesterase
MRCEQGSVVWSNSRKLWRSWAGSKRSCASSTRLRLVPLIHAVEFAAHCGLRAAGIRSHFHAATQGTLHYYQGLGGGTLPAVVCVHGLGSSAASFARTLLKLQHHVCSVAAVNLPGHGYSAVPPGRQSPEVLLRSVSSVLLSLPKEPFILVGNSLGGALALRFALTHPERVHALILSSPAGADIGQDEVARLLRSFRFDSIAEGRRFFERLYHRPPPATSLFAWDLAQAVRQPHLRELIEALHDAEMFRAEQLAQLQVPTLLLWGASDRLMPASAREFFRHHLPPSTHFEELPNIGHSPHLEDPRGFAERVREFGRNATAMGTATNSAN